jgi:hypothetical protein
MRKVWQLDAEASRPPCRPGAARALGARLSIAQCAVFAFHAMAVAAGLAADDTQPMAQTSAAGPSSPSGTAPTS